MAVINGTVLSNVMFGDISGFPENNVIYGFAGNDSYSVRSSTDTIIEATSQGVNLGIYSRKFPPTGVLPVDETLDKWLIELF